MPKTFQWITLLLIENIYFPGIRVKDPQISAWIMTSKFHCTSRKHVQTSNHQTFGKHVQNLISSNIWEARPKFNFIEPLGNTSKFNPSDLWEARPKFNFNGPLGSTSKFKSIGPLGSTSKIQSIGPLGSTPKTSFPLDLWEACPNFNPSDLWEACPNFNPWTSGKHVQNF